jgi:hypothetical protein
MGSVRSGTQLTAAADAEAAPDWAGVSLAAAWLAGAWVAGAAVGDPDVVQAEATMAMTAAAAITRRIGARVVVIELLLDSGTLIDHARCQIR